MHQTQSFTTTFQDNNETPPTKIYILEGKYCAPKSTQSRLYGHVDKAYKYTAEAQNLFIHFHFKYLC